MRSDREHYYINSIDGLRAVAVSLVLLFHADFSWFKGGFIGVDIFFVISGFLITSNILKDLDRDEWSYYSFYTRRIARLFPALFTVIAITGIISYFVLTPNDLIRLAKSGLLAALSISNIYFFSESGYFDSSALTKPLLHTWSLSVEEQFYLMWPTILLLLYVKKSKRSLVIGISLLSLIALSSSIIFSGYNPEMVFFITPFRAYQFGLGALLAISGLVLSRKYIAAKVVAAFTSIVIIILLSNKVSGHDNVLIAAFLPALAASGFIFGSETPIIKRLFSSKILTWIGQRSYSIYLVHWPLIVLWKMKFGQSFAYADKIGVIIVSLILGYVLHIKVEQRYRITSKVDERTKRRSLSFAGGLFSIVIAFSVISLVNNGFPSRVPENLIRSAADIQARWDTRHAKLRNGTCNMLVGTVGDNTLEDFDFEKCIKPDNDKPAYLVIGDSFASDAYMIFKLAFPDVYFGQVTIPGCRLTVPEKINWDECKELYESVITSDVFINKYDGIIFTSNWEYVNLPDLDKVVQRFEALDKRLVMLGQRIRFDTKLPNIVLSSLSKEDAVRKANDRILTMQLKLNDLLKNKYFEKLEYIDLIALQCVSECDIFDDGGNIMYIDDSHLTVEGAQVIAARLRTKYVDLFN